MTHPSPSAKSESVGIFRRMAAMSYDTLLLAAVWMLLTAAFLPLNGGEALDPASLWFHVHRAALVLATLGFFVGFWSGGGQTLGMRAWRFKVIRNDGMPLHVSDGLRRAAASVLSLAPAGLGFWWALFDRDGLAWHDRLSGTRLVRSR